MNSCRTITGLSLLIACLFLVLSSCAAVRNDGAAREAETRQPVSEELAVTVHRLENRQDRLIRQVTQAEEQIQALTEKISRLEDKRPKTQEQTPLASMTDTLDPSPLPDQPEALYQRGRNLLLENNFTGALFAFNTFLSRYPDHDLADNAMYWEGECHYAAGSFNKAADTFKELVKRYPKGMKVPDALLKAGYSYLSLDDPNRARHFLKQVITRYPFSDAAEKAQEKLATFDAF